MYGVHRQWLLNVVAHVEGDGGAVLIRAIEPVEGLDVMARLRCANDVRELMNWPSKLTKALAMFSKAVRAKVLKAQSLSKVLSEAIFK